ncbi:MAG: winged helix-turn-helix domain-containing protein [Legionella sp.]|jgi:DNA-binding response OmpR family regulator
MPLCNYLLIIDKEPIKQELESYFAYFSIKVVHQNCLYPIKQNLGTPMALLINWAILKPDPQILTQLYHSNSVPILVYADTYDEEVCIFALETGADDFLTKPLYPRELHTRIKAISRRTNRQEKTNIRGKDALVFANWRLYPASRQIFDEHNNELQLSAGEYDLLYIFVQQPQRVLDRDFLLQITKQSDHNPFDRRIDVQISRLRQKIEPNTKKPTLIKTIRNGGYIFTAQVTNLVNQTNDREEVSLV